MALAFSEELVTTAQALGLVRSQVVSLGRLFEAEAGFTPTADLAESLCALEQLARVVSYLQVVGAAAADRRDIATVGEHREAPGRLGCPVGPDSPREFKDTAEYLRARIGITRAEARRRIRLGASVLPRRTPTGEPQPAALASVAAAFGDGMISSYAATQIRDAVERVRPSALPEPLQAMEDGLTAQAVESDEDLLNVVIRRWESALDPDGAEPTDELLRKQQGVFLRGRRRGLHRLDIAADDEQFEFLLTVMNTATNPRTARDREMSDASASGGADHADRPSGGGAGDGDAPLWERRSRAQRLLDGLVGACQVALATDTLPATGGHRPQVMVTIDYQALMSDLQERGVVRRDVHPVSERGAATTHRTDRAQPSGSADQGPGCLHPSDGACGDRSHGSLQRTPGPSDQGRRGNKDESIPRPRIAPEPPGRGYTVFGGPVTAQTVRKIACDADIIPVVLGGGGEVLDVGRARRFFGVAQRRALVARDRGCSFPDCTVPAVWTEAHHITPWAGGGRTNVSNGCLLCSFHHRLIERGNWTIEVERGIPWFTPPRYIDPDRTRRRNKHRELALPRPDGEECSRAAPRSFLSLEEPSEQSFEESSDGR
ncbi:DUF222 domain-containing protein [Arthrobacter sp. NPDC092385]|uniref:HNH endonuclease signature motif containing protein n=1 Tax=Arthrobacter sp. NPDC092385 TaxID=3363943 RepID=UPI0038178180